MLLLTTLGAWFPDVWEGRGEIKKTYFKSRYRGDNGNNINIMNKFNKNFSWEKPQYALARYCDYHGRNFPYYMPAQQYKPSVICIYEMGVTDFPEKKGFDLEIKYSVAKKIEDEKIINEIMKIHVGQLMYIQRHSILDSFLDDFCG